MFDCNATITPTLISRHFPLPLKTLQKWNQFVCVNRKRHLYLSILNFNCFLTHRILKLQNQTFVPLVIPICQFGCPILQSLLKVGQISTLFDLWLLDNWKFSCLKSLFVVLSRVILCCKLDSRKGILRLLRPLLSRNRNPLRLVILPLILVFFTWIYQSLHLLVLLLAESARISR